MITNNIMKINTVYFYVKQVEYNFTTLKMYSVIIKINIHSFTKFKYIVFQSLFFGYFTQTNFKAYFYLKLLSETKHFLIKITINFLNVKHFVITSTFNQIFTLNFNFF